MSSFTINWSGIVLAGDNFYCARVKMAEVQFFRLIFNHEQLKLFLEEHGLLITEQKIAELGLLCRNSNCRNPSKGFFSRKRQRKLTNPKRNELSSQGQDINYLNTLQCKCCKTFLSPRTNGFLTYHDSLSRANCKLAPEKILQIIFHWVSERGIRESSEDLGINRNSIVDWYNFCRTTCEKTNIIAHQQPLGNGIGRLFPDQTPERVVQIDECLLRGKRLYNRGRILAGDENILRGDRLDFQQLTENLPVQTEDQRNHGRRITGPWIFGMVDCEKQPDGSYKSGEIRLFKVERRDCDTLLPIIRGNVTRGTVIWSDQWPAYCRLGENDGLIHESVNHSINFVSQNNVHTQNIERIWSALKLKILRNMRGTSSDLLNSHLSEFMWRSRSNVGKWSTFLKIIDDASRENPIQWQR